MKRTQVILEEWQFEALKALSEQQGKSMSELLRKILATHLKPSKRGSEPSLRDIEGILDDPHATGSDHDRYLYGGRRKKR